MKKTVKFGIGIVIGIILIYLITSIAQPKTQIQEETTNVENLNINPQFSIVSEEINYYESTQGYYARPSEEGIYPGVVMIHEWWGLNDNIKQTADNLAAQGYNVLAVDLYNGEVATESSDAGRLAGSVRANPDEAINNMNAAITYLENQDSDKLASLGWCFGGQQSLQISLNNPDLDATVIYYGNLVTDEEELSSIDHPVLGIFGEEDSSIPVATVNEFDTALDNIGVENQIYIYPGVGHAFANPSGNNYAPDETEDAWMKTLNFLDENLKN